MSLLVLLLCIFGIYIALRYIQSHEKLVDEIRRLHPDKVSPAAPIETTTRDTIMKALSGILMSIPRA